jgi:hypothetical protein
MKKNLFILLIGVFGFGTSMQGQFGVSALYNTNDYADWNKHFNSPSSAEVLSSGYEVGLDYWFRLKNKRIEFLPGISYSLDNKTESEAFNLSLSSINLNFPTQFYILDLGEDCNCPTFSKSGPGFEKGFFVHLSPGLTYVSTNYNNFITPADNFNHLAFRVGVGFGLDIGINDFLTITPKYSYIYNSGKKIQTTLDSNPEITEEISSSENQHQFGLRMGFRFDYNNGRRR